MRFSIFILIISLLVIYSQNVCYSQNQSSASISEANGFLFNWYDNTTVYSIEYSHRSVPPDNGNSSIYENDGNNFYGIGVSNKYVFSNFFTISLNSQFQLGNINGDICGFLSVVPKMMYTFSIGFKAMIGVGTSMLLPSKKTYQTGGVGLTSLIGLEIPITSRFSIEASGCYEGYPKTNYLVSSFGINMRF
jgi:hypothetical protein